ncbi:hypothetical protein MHU86_16873 [Fragilaria crotonensis]|nr:hypothetical protein MHU86_16873 [Fragilaria crotonensis]
MDLFTLENIGTLNSLNGFTPKDSSNPSLNPPILSFTTNTTNGYAFSSLSTTCSTLAAMTPSKKNSKNLSAIALTSSSLDLLNGSCKCVSINTKTKPTLDQHRYVLNTLQRYDPNSEFPERETPFPPDYTFSKDNRPVTDHDKQVVEQHEKRLPFRSAVCTLLYLAYNTRADILLQSANLQKPASALANSTSVLLSG